MASKLRSLFRELWVRSVQEGGARLVLRHLVDEGLCWGLSVLLVEVCIGNNVLKDWNILLELDKEILVGRK